MAAFPDALASAAYVGRFGWVERRVRRRSPTRSSASVIDGAWRADRPEEAGRGGAYDDRRPMTSSRRRRPQRSPRTNETAGARRIAAAFAARPRRRAGPR